MLVTPYRSLGRLALALTAVASLAVLGGCNSFGMADRTRSALNAITPYKIEVVQGNFVSKEQVAQLKPGITRQQVREVLGTSLLTDVFHSNRWDYVFTIKRQGVDPQQRRLTVFFNGELMERYEGDEMPSEQEFVAQLDTRKRSGKIPELQATDDQLNKFTPEKPKETTGSSSASMTPLPASYPPLESR
jgi:outer membrane protein assembly factor BamE